MMKLIANRAMTLVGVISVSSVFASTTDSTGKLAEADFHVGSFVMFGLMVVLGILLLLSVLTGIMGKIFVSLENKQKVALASAKPIAPVVTTCTDEDDMELVAVLAAAAMEALDAEVRIVSYKPSFNTWSKEGRVTQAGLVNNRI